MVFLIGARFDKLHLVRSLADLGGRRGMKHMPDYLVASQVPTSLPAGVLTGLNLPGVFGDPRSCNHAPEADAGLAAARSRCCVVPWARGISAMR